jgi:bifunctional non-homologous end joining protein LigD
MHRLPETARHKQPLQHSERSTEAAMGDKLSEYARKRQFERTPEPSGSARASARHATGRAAVAKRRAFVIQKHAASHLHYDFRLELDGTLKSWAIPKGPSLDPGVKRLAVHVEDHPLEYAQFEGRIPAGNYGAGEVIVWDRGTWEPDSDDPGGDFARGKLKFSLAGDKLSGGWTLVKSRMRSGGSKEQDTWLLIKERDAQARAQAEFSVTEARPESVITGAKLTTAARKSNRSTEGGKTHPAAKQPAVRKFRAARRKAGPIAQAVAAALPATLAPQLATLVYQPPADGDWSYEIKFDGYRLLARIDRSGSAPVVRLLTRNGHDWTHKFSHIAGALEQLDLDAGWLDGEAAVLDANGIPSFQALQSALDGHQEDIVFYLFDMPYMNGWDLRRVPLAQRRALLDRVLRAHLDTVAHSPLRFSADLEQAVEDLLRSACAMRLEGIVGKRRDSAYGPGRTGAWIKLKCRQRQEFVIGGYSEPAGKRSGFGALLLGVHDARGQLHYAGRVGTGFDQARLAELGSMLKRRKRARSPFRNAPKERSSPVHWVRPDLVAEIMFNEWTADGLVRQAAFVALRDDKPAAQVVREVPSDATIRKTSKSMPAQDKARDRIAGVEITHPARLIDPAAHIDKNMLARYYASIAQQLLPHLANRPVALLRGMDGITGELFFQKHEERMVIPHVTRHADLDPGHAPLLTIDNVAALIGAVQMGTLEFHTWNASIRNLEKPDRMIFDLDPDPNLNWPRMTEAGQLLHMLLDELGLKSFIKTSGGKGFHVVVPLRREAGWDEVKAFSRAISAHLASTFPKLFAAKMGPRNRIGKIFIDYLRNARGASTVAAYSARARAGMGVSVPVGWDEIPHLESADQWNIKTVVARVEHLREDPWAAYPATRQRITVAMKRKLGLV